MRLLELTEFMGHPTGVAEVPEHRLEPGKAGQWVSGGWGRRGTGGLTGASVPGSSSRSCGPPPESQSPLHPHPKAQSWKEMGAQALRPCWQQLCGRGASLSSCPHGLHSSQRSMYHFMKLYV